MSAHHTLTRRAPRVALLMTMVALVVAVAAGCGEDQAEVDAEQVLSDAVTAMEETASFHFLYEVEKPPGTDPPAGLDIVALEGDVSTEGEMEATVDVQQSGIPLQVTFIAVDETHYLKFPVAPVWQSVPESESPLGPLNLSAGTIRILERIDAPVYEGEEEVDGVPTYRVSGMAPAEDVEAIAQAVSRTEPFPAEVWIGVEDSLVHRIRLSGAATDSEPEDTVRHIYLSDFDEPVDIEPPV